MRRVSWGCLRGRSGIGTGGGIISVGVLLIALLSSGCSSSSVSKALNPLQLDPDPEAFLGSPNSHALNGATDKQLGAREALEAMATYQQQFSPSPNRPVLQPAVVRIMWVPDHLNASGDLVPAHYYYLKVRDDQWAVQDAFEIYDQLDGKSAPPSNPSGIPYVPGKK